MKRIRRLILMAISTLFIVIMVSGTALAASKYYVPVEGKMYRYNSEYKNWGRTEGTFTATFSKDGKLKKEEVYIGGILERRVENKWKGNYLTKSTETTLLRHQPDTGITTGTYTYKNGKMSKSKSTLIIGGKTLDKSSATYKWKKNKGTEILSNGQKFSITLKKGRVSKAKDKKNNYTSTYTYYGNYLMKKKSTETDSSFKETKYNKYGLPVSEIEKSYIMNASGSVTFTYNWTIKNGVPKEVVVTRHHSPSNVDVIYKWVFTKTKQVSKLRNCDRYGHLTDLYISARY